MPTHLQKADGLTKQLTASQRRMIFHHNVENTEPVPGDVQEDEDENEYDTGCTWLVCAIPRLRGGEC